MVVYTPEMHAGEREELELAYQPIVDVESGGTTGLETLLRWRTSESESVPPSDFIPVAEASGLIVPLGAWVLERACADVVGLGDVHVAVNVFAVQLRADDFVTAVAGAREAFEALRALGVAIAIDDFGTGFSSLAALADLPFDILKLDRSFVASMSSSPARQALVGGVVSLADPARAARGRRGRRDRRAVRGAARARLLRG